MFCFSSIWLFAPIAGCSIIVVPVEFRRDVPARIPCGQSLGHDLVNFAGEHAFTQQLACGFHCLGINIGHLQVRLLGSPAISARENSTQYPPAPAISSEYSIRSRSPTGDVPEL